MAEKNKVNTNETSGNRTPLLLISPQRKTYQKNGPGGNQTLGHCLAREWNRKLGWGESNRWPLSCARREKKMELGGREFNSWTGGYGGEN